MAAQSEPAAASELTRNALGRALASFDFGRRSQPQLGRWLLFTAWLGFGVRAGLLTRITSAGFMDDLAFAVLAAVPFVLLGALDRGSRLLLQGLLGLTMIAALFADTIHFRFFGSFVTFESILVARHVDEAGDSVLNLMESKVIALGLSLPLALLVYALSSEMRRRRRSPIRPATVMLCVGAAAFLLSTWFIGDLTGAAFNNPVVLFARQALASPDDEEIHDELVDDHGATFGLPSAGYHLLGEDAPLEQVPDDPQDATSRPNVVLILMESVRAYETAQGRGASSVTPNLDALADRGLQATQFYAVGHQTVRGEGALLCGSYTNFGGAPIYVRFPFLKMRCLPEILQEQGWSTHWISSFDRTYFNKELFLTSHGIERMHDMHEVRNVERRLGWGPSDSEMFEYAADTLDESTEPFFAEIMTLSNHDPFNHGYPIDRPEAAPADSTKYRNYLHGVHYTDASVGHFFEIAATRPWFANTIFIVTGDHGARTFPQALDRELEPAREVEFFHRMPFFVFGPGVDTTQISFVASQIDLAPTILDLLGIRTAHAFQGRSLLADIPEDERFAVFSTANAWHIRQGDDYCYSTGTACVPGGIPDCDGQPPEPAEHACFETTGDLLGLGPVHGRLLPEPAARALRDRGAAVVRFTQHLIRTDTLMAPGASESEER